MFWNFSTLHQSDLLTMTYDLGWIWVYIIIIALKCTQTHTHLVEVRVRNWLMLALVIITPTESQSTAKWPIKTDQLENTFYRSAGHITGYLISFVSSGTKFSVCVCVLLKSCHLSSHQGNQAKMSWIIINHQPFPYTNTHLCSTLWESAWMKG